MDDERRGRVAWHMNLIDVLIGHNALGFDYPMNGNARPEGTPTETRDTK